MYFKHNSWDKFYKDPFGAAPIGQEVTFRVTSNETVNIYLHTRFRDNDNYYLMEQSPNNPEVYEVTIAMPNTPGLLWYDFHFDAFNSHYVYGAQPDGMGGEGQVNLFTNNSYQITVYNPDRKVPDWYKEGVMYQIFPDRFYHATRDDFIPFYPPHTILHTNWNDSPHYFRRPDGSIDYYDFFGGNLLGIINKLDYLKELGISIIYLNPIFESHSNHKYDTADYLRIAPEFGNSNIFEELCSEADKRGIKIILDGVFNHTGDNSRYFNKYGDYYDLGAYQDINSPYADWYEFESFPDKYNSWWGVSSMPATNKNNINFQNFIYAGDSSVVRHWLKKGASGWRLDVADELPDDFIVGIKESMLTEKPDSVLIGEVWEDASNKVAYSQLKNYFLGKELDSVMNYPFREALLNFFRGYKSSAETVRSLMSLYDHYPRENFMANMNLIGSHDRKRVLTVLGSNPAETDHLSEIEKENYYLTEEELFLAKKKLKLLALVQMTFPGVPSIYYGDEIGTEGLSDPYNRRTFNWNDGDMELFDWYKQIIKLRNNSDVLKKGELEFIPTTDDLFAFVRSYNGDKVLVAVNRNPYNTYSLSYGNNLIGKDYFTGQDVKLDDLEVPPFGYMIVEF